MCAGIRKEKHDVYFHNTVKIEGFIIKYLLAAIK